jgi:hypothetical protein
MTQMAVVAEKKKAEPKKEVKRINFLRKLG